jgi:LysM repeat protein
LRDNTNFIYHKLAAGETLFALSKKYGVSEDEIIKCNPGREVNKQPLGTEIIIPKDNSIRLKQSYRYLVRI